MHQRELPTKQLRVAGSLATILLLVTACSSSESTPETTAPAPTLSHPSAPADIREEVARLKNEVQSVQEKMRSFERNLEVLLRGRRSGLYESESANGAIDLPKEAVSPLTESQLAPAGRTLEHPPAKTPTGVSPSPRETVADAELKMQRGQHGESVVILTELQRTTPDYADDGHSLILLAECWNQLKQFDNAIQSLRTFYLKFPKSNDFLKGKILEAAAYEGLGSRERAIGIYREVVALGPKTGHAQTARSAMQRLRDE